MSTTADQSSLLFTNARLTNDASHALYSVLVQSGIVAQIAHIGDEQTDLKADATFDLRGHYVAPSMVDHHVHFSMWAKMRSRVSLAGIDSLKEAIEILREASTQMDPVTQPALVGQGLLLGRWSDEDVACMTFETLDSEIATTYPIIIYMNDLHSFWCNSAAMDWLDIPANAEGRTTGLFRELECFTAMVVHNKKEEDVLESLLIEASIDAATKGVTSIVDLDWDFNIKNWTGRVQRGMRYLRIECGMYRDHIQEAIDSGYKTGDVVPGTDGLVTVGPMKLILDGSLGTRTACCHHAYPSPPAKPDDFGLLTYAPDDFRSMFKLAIDQQFRLAIHTIGDKTASVIFDELEKLPHRPLAGSSIEHAQLMLEEDLPRMKALGLAASIQPQHLNDDRELSERFWPGRTARAFAYKAIADAGVELRLGSDAPVAPLDPWMAIAAAVSRLRKGETGEGWHPEQKLTIEQAYEASTLGRRLQVREGDIADLCILPVDPLRATIDEIWNMQPSATLLCGRFTWNDLR